MDINEDKFAHAKEWGATDCINPTKCENGIVSEIIKMTTTDAPNDPGGVDFVRRRLSPVRHVACYVVRKRIRWYCDPVHLPN